jgi:N12 class adenine-specific DNA methylase
MGIDGLIIDESHEYKRLGFTSNIDRVRGIDKAASKKAVSAYLKIASVMDRTGGKNIIFATGTPVTNTMAELWTNMRYLIPERIKEMGISTFDQFQQTFTEIQV